METKTYKITTLADLFHTVNNENADRLIADLSFALKSYAKWGHMLPDSDFEMTWHDDLNVSLIYEFDESTQILFNPGILPSPVGKGTPIGRPQLDLNKSKITILRT